MKVPWARKAEVAHRAAIAGAVTVPSGESVEIGKSRPQAWQMRAWQLWGMVGEIHYPTSHMARQVGRLSWTVTIDGDVLDDDAADELLSAATAGLGLREASRLLALNFQVAGEVRYVLGSDDEWHAYSVVTAKLDELVEAAKKDNRPEYRLYNPDPVDEEKADSSVRTVLGPAEELITLEALSRAQSRSRIAQAGMLLVPVEAMFDGDADPFGRDLETAMMAPIADETSPAAMVPVKVELPAEMIPEAKGGPRHLSFDRPYDETIHEKQERAIKRVALALDIPAELLLGTSEATHWTAWLTALETYTSHLEPLAAPIGELFADVIFDLLAKQGREVNVTVEPDASEILAKRSTVRDAMDAAKIGAVSLSYVREAIGAGEGDAPTDDELAILRLIPREPGREIEVDEQTGGPSDENSPLAAAGVPPADETGKRVAAAGILVRSGFDPASSLEAVGLSPIEHLGLLPVTVKDQQQLPSAAPVEDIAPDEPAVAASQNGHGSNGGHDSGYERGRLEGVLAMACDGARTRIGSKLRTQFRGTPLTSQIDGIHNRDVVATLGLEQVRSQDTVDLNRLVVDALTPFSEWWEASWDSPLPAAIASLLVGVWVADTLGFPTAEIGQVPESLLSDLTRGVEKEMSNA